jgi:hypothetical protein
MSFYSDASLALIPSGYKNGKVYSALPTDGSGDMSFTRASNATRVASNGLIEKVRTNLLLQSNTFNTTWVTTSASVTSGQSGYDGTNNAWLLNVTAGSGSQRIEQNVVSSTSTTYSFYVKAGTVDWVALRVTGTPVNCLVWFDLSTGTKGSNQNATNYTITSVGSGWYRCTLTTNTTIGEVYIYPATGDDIAGLNCVSGDNILIQASQLEAGDIATDYIATTTAAVSVGPVSGLPRLDYLNSTCPRLLLEPQRTNLQVYSENGTGTNWGNPFQISLTANQTASPDGYVNADAVFDNANNSPHRFEPFFNATSGQAYTFSYFAKANTLTQCHIFGFADNAVFASQTAIFDLSAGTVVSNTGNGIPKIESYGNGWYRVSLTLTAGATAVGYFGFGPAKSGSVAYLGDGSSLYMWGIQLEAGAYATSYIPTLGTSVTRVADTAIKTGISSLIGQTEGTLFLEFSTQPEGLADARISISDGSAANWIFLGKDGTQYRALVRASNSLIYSNIAEDILDSSVVKMAIAYKSGEIAYYFNGTLRSSSSSFSFNATLDRLIIGNTNVASVVNEAIKINQLLLFPTRLSNDQLAELTA